MEAIYQSDIRTQQGSPIHAASILGQIHSMPNPTNLLANYPRSSLGQSFCVEVPTLSGGMGAAPSALPSSLTAAIDRLSQSLQAVIERLGSCFCAQEGSLGMKAQTEPSSGIFSSVSSFLKDEEAVQGTLSSIASIVPGLGWLSNAPKIVAGAQMLGNLLGAFTS